MDSIKRINYKINETEFENSAEQSINMEITLPEYCGDISSILHCFAFANITSGTINKDYINIEGSYLVRVIYLSEGEIFSYEQSAPFSKKIEHECESIGTVLDLKTFVQYVNCRAINPRKLEISGAFVISAKISACNSTSVIDSIDNESVEINTDKLSACTACGNSYADINLSQVIDIGSGKPAIKSIIRNSSEPIIIETKQISGKVLVKGELKIKSLYKAEDNSTQYIENSIPLSHILDIEGCKDDSIVDLKLNLNSLDVIVKPSAIGNMSLLDINAVIRVSACAYECIDFPVLKDCYSTKFESSCSFKTVKIDSILENISKSFMHSFETEPLPELNRVIDLWCDDIRIKALKNGDKLTFKGVLKCYVLYGLNDNSYSIKELESDFSFEDELICENDIKCEPTATVIGTDYLVKGSALEVRISIKVDAVVFASRTEKIVDDIEILDNALNKKSSLIVYFAKQGEKLWDIARKYQTTTDLIVSENSLEGDTLDKDKALIIWA